METNISDIRQSGANPIASKPTPSQPEPRQPSQPQEHKPQRVLACEICQRRKVKCDRHFPCANCVRHKVQCVPATLAVRRKRRTIPQRELLGRLHKYEELLRRNNVKFEPFGADSWSVDQSPSEEHDDSGDERPQSEAAVPTSPATSQKSEYTKNIWQAMSQDGPDTEEGPRMADFLEHTIKSTWSLGNYDDIALFRSQIPSVDLYTLHPTPVDIFRLWQVYLENVNPLLKVTHTPSLQVRIIEAASNVREISAAQEALMFSIYSLAIASLGAEECEAMFGLSQADLMTKYQFACQQALVNARFLRSENRDCLTALLFHLMSLNAAGNLRFISSMLSVAIRNAQYAGMHREVFLAKCAPFEAEMRRRLWWRLVLYDTRVGEKTDLREPLLAPTWDCKRPLNVNDSDLRPDMSEEPSASTRTTDALFLVAQCQVADFIRHNMTYLEFTNPALKPLAKPLPHNGDLLALEKKIETEHLASLDMENPVHLLAAFSTRALLAKGRLTDYFAKFARSDIRPTDEQRDEALTIAFRMLDCDTRMMASSLSKNFQWFLEMMFPFPAYIHIIQDLRRRPLGPLADKAWDTMAENGAVRVFPRSDGGNILFHMFSRIVELAWNARLAALASSKSNVPTEPPRLIVEIKRVEAEHVAKTVKQASEAGHHQHPITHGMTNDIDVNAFLASMPMGLGNNDLYGDITMGIADGGQTGDFAHVDSSLQQDATSMNPTAFDINNVNWPPMDWGSS